jgi:CRP-like cAMP-binding protein
MKEQVQRIEIFKDFSSKQIDELYSWLQRRDFKQGDDIITQGHQSNGLYLLTGGTVSVVKKGTVRKVKLTEIEAPSFFGEIGLLAGGSRTAVVRAKTNVVIAYLPGLLFDNKLADDNITALRISLSIGRLLSRRLAETTELLAQTAVLALHQVGGERG